jgi:hypothetical protein
VGWAVHTAGMNDIEVHPTKSVVRAEAKYKFFADGRVVISIYSFNGQGDVIKTREISLSDLEAEALFLMTQGT